MGMPRVNYGTVSGGEVRGHLENQNRRDTMVGLCIGMREPRWYDGLLDRFDRRAMDVY